MVVPRDIVRRAGTIIRCFWQYSTCTNRVLFSTSGLNLFSVRETKYYVGTSYKSHAPAIYSAGNTNGEVLAQEKNEEITLVPDSRLMLRYNTFIFEHQ